MSVILKSGNSSDLANVNADKELTVSPTKNKQKAGYVSLLAESDEGLFFPEKKVKALEASDDYRLRVGVDNILWDDTFNHTVTNLSKYQVVTNVMTVVQASGSLNFNSSNNTASGSVARWQTYRNFTLFGSFPIYQEFWVKFSNTFQTNSFHEFGLGFATTTTTPTDGVFFRVAGTQLQGVCNNNGAELITNITFTPAINTYYKFLIINNNDETEFWIDDEKRGEIVSGAGLSSASLSNNLPLLLRQYNNGVVGAAIQMQIGKITISQGDLQNNKLWGHTMSAMGQNAMNAPDAAATGQTANYANTIAPANATLSNVAAGYATLGGQFQFIAVAGAETDYALFAYQVPVAGAAVPGKNLYIRGIRIETINTGAAVATSAHLLQWGLGIGSTGVSLATADSATAGTRAPRRVALGFQTFPIGAAIAATSTPIDYNFDVPFVVEAGTFFHVILKMPIATATASQVIRGTVLVNGFFE